MCSLPSVHFEQPSPLSAPGSSRSFITAWPIRLARTVPFPAECDATYLCSRFCSLLETQVACKGWQAWVLAECPLHHALHVVGLEKDAKQKELCWLLIWQTRQHAPLQKQKGELRRLWEMCRWCPTGAEDFEDMFEESSLVEAQRTLHVLDALICQRSGLQCKAALHDMPSPDNNADHSIPFPLPPGHHGLRLTDLRREDAADSGGSALRLGAAIGRIHDRYVDLLALFPRHAGCPPRGTRNCYAGQDRAAQVICGCGRTDGTFLVPPGCAPMRCITAGLSTPSMWSGKCVRGVLCLWACGQCHVHG